MVVPGRLGPGEVWELRPWPGCRVADDPGMMESLLHTDNVSAKEGHEHHHNGGCKEEENPLKSSVFSRTFVVEDALHLHGGPGVGNAEHGTGNQTLQGR